MKFHNNSPRTHQNNRKQSISYLPAFQNKKDIDKAVQILHKISRRIGNIHPHKRID